MPEQNYNQRRRQSQWGVGTLNVLTTCMFWGMLALLLASAVLVGMGRYGWAEIRHEIRRRKSK